MQSETTAKKQPEAPRKSVRRLQKGELKRAASTLALAFDDDPVFRDLMGAEGTRRQTWLRWFHESALGECAHFDSVYTFDGDDGPEQGVIGIVPPGQWPVPLYRTLATAALPRTLPTMRLARWGLHLENKIRGLHPEETHLYVYVLGVHPELKGKGFGGVLLRHARSLAREANCIMHLETGNPVNLPFYRRFEFEVKTEIVSHGGPPVWTMTTPAPPRQMEDER